MAARRYPGESVGEAGGSAERGRQGLPRPSGPFAGLKTAAVTLRGQPADSSSAISAMLNNGRGRGRGTLTSPPVLASLLAPTFFWLCNHQRSPSPFPGRQLYLATDDGLREACVTASTPPGAPSHSSLLIPLLFLFSSRSSSLLFSSSLFPAHFPQTLSCISSPLHFGSLFTFHLKQ